MELWTACLGGGHTELPLNGTVSPLLLCPLSKLLLRRHPQVVDEDTEYDQSKAQQVEP